jgi:hypothetical protein
LRCWCADVPDDSRQINGYGNVKKCSQAESCDLGCRNTRVLALLWCVCPVSRIGGQVCGGKCSGRYEQLQRPTYMVYFPEGANFTSSWLVEKGRGRGAAWILVPLTALSLALRAAFQWQPVHRVLCAAYYQENCPTRSSIKYNKKCAFRMGAWTIYSL